MERGDIIKITSKMLNGDAVRLAEVLQISLSHVIYMPVYNQKLCKKHNALDSGQGSITLSRIGARMYGVQSIEVVLENPNNYRYAGFWDAMESARATRDHPNSLVRSVKSDGGAGVIQKRQPSGEWYECVASEVAKNVMSKLRLEVI